MEDPKIIAERILQNVEHVIIGKAEAVRLALVALMCRGHVLIEDVPGVGKTILIGKIPVKIKAEAIYYLEQPDSFGPHWGFRLTLTPVVPKLFVKQDS